MAEERCSWSRVCLPDHIAKLVDEYKSVFGREATSTPRLEEIPSVIDLSGGKWPH